ncbi:Dpagt1 [Symbiodinium sp. CCMP2456]|nr:Dpagt1 [Symbiodinium sp. CCMP2456]
MAIQANLRGIDLNKQTTKRDADGNLVRPIEGIPIPESQGTIAAAVYILLLSVFIPFAFARENLELFPHNEMAEYLAAVLTITFASFMGFADDVLDLRWRYKIPLPFLATLPLLLVYYANGNETGVMVPNQLRWLFGDAIDLGVFFYAFLLLLAVFSTHAINIYAGVNGLEVGQAVVIAGSVLLLNIIQLHRIPDQYKNYRDSHVQSIFLIVPFLAVSMSLLRLNWFPATVFVGDTYCYFAGMTLAVVSIIGHISKTMVLLLIPQVLNFLYSCPQLFSFMGIPCPRHRMPAYNASNGTVCNSYAEFKPAELKPLGRLVFTVLKSLRLVHLKPGKEEGSVMMSNLTLINFVLYVPWYWVKVMEMVSDFDEGLDKGAFTPDIKNADFWAAQDNHYPVALGKWWSWSEGMMQAYGPIAAIPISAMPIILHPLIFFAKLSKMSDFVLLTAILVGRVVKYSIMAQMALTAPHLLKFFGASQEVIQQVKKTKAN